MLVVLLRGDKVKAVVVKNRAEIIRWAASDIKVWRVELEKGHFKVYLVSNVVIV